MYIKDSYCISPQNSHDQQLEITPLFEANEASFELIEPDYSHLIPNNLLRRMGKAVRVSIGCGIPLLEKYKVDGLVLATGNGGLEDCIKFLNQIVEYNEGTLTPTNFVQSTPNASAGQLAMMTKNRGYNNTHVNSAIAFENALTDAQMELEFNNSSKLLLVGAVEEISSYNYNIDLVAKRIKTEIDFPSGQLELSKTPGAFYGEGATMFVVSNEPEPGSVKIDRVFTLTSKNTNQAIEKVLCLIDEFEPDLLLLGSNGDALHDETYKEILKSKPINHLFFKKWCGEYRTASAFGTYLAQQLLLNKVNGFDTNLKRILLYNQFENERHSIQIISI